MLYRNSNMTIPNFLIIGDLKAGSTSLYNYLKQHPDVYMPSDIKELRYFSYDDNNSYHKRAKSTQVRTFSEYQSYFDKCENQKAIGEASPNYLRSPIAAKNIKNQLPGVKLIVSLRNPADRMYSAYMMATRSGRIKIEFDEYCFRDNGALIKTNGYWADLIRYYDIFDDNQIKVILFDEIKANASGIVKDLFQFLEVDDTFEPKISVQNKGGMPKNQFVYASMVAIKDQVKKIINPSDKLKNVWKGIKGKSLTETKIDPQIKAKILDVCKDDLLRTQALINKDLSNWMG